MHVIIRLRGKGQICRRESFGRFLTARFGFGWVFVLCCSLFLLTATVSELPSDSRLCWTFCLIDRVWREHY